MNMKVTLCDEVTGELTEYTGVIRVGEHDKKGIALVFKDFETMYAHLREPGEECDKEQTRNDWGLSFCVCFSTIYSVQVEDQEVVSTAYAVETAWRKAWWAAKCPNAIDPFAEEA